MFRERNHGCRWAIVWVGLVQAIAFAQSTQTVVLSPASALFQNTVTVALSGAEAGQQIRYVVASGAGAAEVAVTADSPLYTGPITLDRTAVLRAAVFPAGGGASGRATTGAYVKLGAGTAAVSSRLPVLVLDDFGAGPLVKDDVNHQAWLWGFDGNAASSFAQAPVFSSPILASVRGSSSAEFPKKGYNIRMRDTAYRSRALPIFDLPAYERWALVAPWSFDASYINNAFMYELSNRIGRWAPRTKLTELFFNTGADALESDDYMGIYVVMDRIRAEPGRVDVDRLTKDDTTPEAISGGYVLKIDPPDPDELGWVTEHGVPADPATKIVLVEPGAEDITPAQLDYIKSYVQQMENALYADRASGWAQRTYLDYLDRSSWVDHHILNVLASNPDALVRSAYFTKPRGGKLQAEPVWDFDRALGGFWDDRTSVVNTWSGVGAAVDVWRSGWWGLLAADPDFIQEWIDRWQSLRRTDLSTPALTTLAQNLADNVGIAAAQRDAARWPDSAPPQGSYPAQIAYLQSWLTQRAAWIDAQFIAAPTVAAQGADVTFTPAPGALLAYTLDGTDPRASGGGVAPNAIVHAGALTLPIAAGARVRSYDPTLVAADGPSSHWSMPVQRFRTSAAIAGGRLVNLSTKATVAGGVDTLIVGFVVAETDAKRYLVRAVGPGLAVFGEPSLLPNPALNVTNPAGASLARSDVWHQESLATQLPAIAQSAGAFPLTTSTQDAATVVTLPRGAYTAQVTSRTTASGTALAEIYELDTAGRTANISVRGRATATRPLTGGFVLGGPGNTRLLIRAVGPALRNFGVSDAAADTAFTLRSGANVVATNDSWSAGGNAAAVEDAGRTAGAFPLGAGSQDAALVTVLPPGNYTVEVTAASTGGIVLFELYELP